MHMGVTKAVGSVEDMKGYLERGWANRAEPWALEGVTWAGGMNDLDMILENVFVGERDPTLVARDLLVGGRISAGG